MSKKYFRRPGTVIKWWNPYAILAYSHYQEQLDWVIKQFEWKGKEILDIGTGYGRFAIPVAVNGAEVDAIDISKDMLKYAKKKQTEFGVTLKFCLGDAENLPFKDEPFDIVICVETFMHLPNPQKAVSEISRVLKTGGKAVVQMNNKLCFRQLTEFQVAIFDFLKRKHSPQIEWRYTTREFKKFFKNVELKILKTRGQDLFHLATKVFITTSLPIPIFLPKFVDWFFKNVEEKVRETPLLHIMDKVMVLVTKV